ncbi:MAG: DUF1552 domain-containing protein [Deltaproteobacteria bacterium]|nr:DUF1552 domain-containing protein [Deltaproteobacteria bacterium]
MINQSRRKLIAQAGAWPLLWPLVQHGMARAAGDVVPKRVVVIFSPNGPITRGGIASGTETNFTINDYWAPLQRHKADGCFFVGCHQAGVPFGKHNEYGHQSGGTGALTARTTEGTNNSTGPSLDQFIGQELQKAGIVTPKRSILMGLHKNVGNWGPWYEAAGKPALPMVDPYKILADIMPSVTAASGGTSTPAVDKVLLRKNFVLDAIYKDCKELAGSLGSDAKALLDFHCGNIESLQKSVAKSISAAPMSGPACVAPTKPNTTLASTANFEQADNRDEIMKAFTDLVALSFSCDVTRVVGISFGETASRFAIPAKYGVGSAAQVDSGDSGPQHHAWTHTYNNGPEKQMALKLFYNWYAEKVALLIDKLKTTMDANGKPLMDTTLVIWTSELGGKDNDLEPHPNHNIPVSMFGNSQGAFKTGRLYSTKDPQDKSALVLHSLFVSAIQHAGLTNINTFGNQGTGGLAWLKG